ncbi:MAG: PUR family DNA/RNA-binding protein [Bacteroidales bacterium]|nr:PUR family DNA/RNA-binding protein [Bacteroidales bacterium]
MKEDFNSQSREEIFSEAVRAGKRTYFFDVKATRRDDYYLTITESKKKFNREGNSFYEKHKIFLYKEDFEKFIAGLSTAIDYIKENNPQGDAVEYNSGDPDTKMSEEFTNVEFEDLGSRKD